jgi:hypothetical protein
MKNRASTEFWKIATLLYQRSPDTPSPFARGRPVAVTSFAFLMLEHGLPMFALLCGCRYPAKILGYRTRKPKRRLRPVNSIIIKVHQTAQDAIRISRTPALWHTRVGNISHTPRTLMNAYSSRPPPLFSRQCTETTATRQHLPLLANIWSSSGKGLNSDEARHLIEDNGSLTCITPRSNRTNHRLCDPEFVENETWSKTFFNTSSNGPA